MGKISELKEQKSHRAANDGLEQRGERRKVGERGIGNEHITNPKQATTSELASEFYKQTIAVKLNIF